MNHDGLTEPVWCAWCGIDIPTDKELQVTHFCSLDCDKAFWADIKASGIDLSDPEVNRSQWDAITERLAKR